MFTKSEIEEIVLRTLKGVCNEIYLSTNVPIGEMRTERVVVSVHRSVPQRYWINTPITLSWCIPAIEGEVPYKRKAQVEKALLDYRHRSGGGYHWSMESLDCVEDNDMRCHYVVLKLLFQQINTL